MPERSGLTGPKLTDRGKPGPKLHVLTDRARSVRSPRPVIGRCRSAPTGSSASQDVTRIGDSYSTLDCRAGIDTLPRVRLHILKVAAYRANPIALQCIRSCRLPFVRDRYGLRLWDSRYIGDRSPDGGTLAVRPARPPGTDRSRAPQMRRMHTPQPTEIALTSRAQPVAAQWGVQDRWLLFGGLLPGRSRVGSVVVPLIGSSNTAGWGGRSR